MIKKNNPIRKRLQGIVVSDKMNKTVVVRVERFKKHPLYHKVIGVSKRFKAHDENNSCKMGDLVVIEQTRPLSKEKRWKVVQIIKKAEELTDLNNAELEIQQEGEIKEILE